MECISVCGLTILNPIVLKSFVNFSLKRFSKTISRFMYFIVKILGQTRSIQNSVSSLNCIDDLNLEYWFPLYEKISHRWWFRDHCFYKTMRIWRKKDPQAKFLLISRDFFLPFFDKKVVLTRKMVLQTELNPQIERRERR